MSNQQISSPTKKNISSVPSTFFTLPQISSKAYKETAAQIHTLMANLDSYTQNLESKVDSLLSNQQAQFIHGYKQHMIKVKNQFESMQEELKKLKEKIEFYESQGRLSILLKKVMKLEEQNKKLLLQIANKNKDIKSMQLGMQIDRKEMKRLEAKVKEFIRFKVMLKQEKQRNDSLSASHVLKNQTLGQFRNPSPQPNMMFATEVNLQAKQRPANIIPVSKDKAHLNKNYSIPHCIQNSQEQQSNGKISKFLTEEHSLNLHSLNQKSQQATNAYNCNSQINRLERQIKNLKKQNSKLLLYSSKFLQSANSMENFFFETVNDIRRNISVRKKVRDCSLEDFRKQDKLELLIRILSNDDIIVHLHQKIFGKNQNQVEKLLEQGRFGLQHYQTQKKTKRSQTVDNSGDDKEFSRKKGFSFSHRNEQGNLPLLRHHK